MIFLLPQAIDRAAERFPDHDAIRCWDQRITYAEFAQKTNCLARSLIEQGVQRRDRVGVYMHKSLESAIAIYGIMKAGAAYVPLDPSAPVARLDYIVRHCGIRHLVTQTAKREALQQLSGLETPLECLIGLQSLANVHVRVVPWAEVYNMPVSPTPDVGIIEQDLAYIMYTSGSTGEPKGIMHTHHSGLSYAHWTVDAYSLHHQDRIANHAPLHFDISTFDFFGGALAGSTVVIVPEEHMKLPASYSKLLEDERISVIFTVPFALIQLLLRGALDTRDLSALRWVIFGGEPFPTKYLRDLMRQLPHAGFSNIYGPAEVNGVTFFHILTLPDDDEEPVPIGRECPFAQALVVDEHDKVVADGEIGELLIRSPTMMQGYWSRNDLNQRAFYRKPVFPDYEEVYYRTGDLVRRQADGDYKFLGRKDRQIKTRGYRVELDEVEAKFLSHAQVEEAAVYPVPDADGMQRVEAAVILKAGADALASDLSQHVARLLPWYAVPGKIALVSSFPRTTSGKIDRQQLRKRAIERGMEN
jgi:amino acid adenylation domain-containing protein